MIGEILAEIKVQGTRIDDLAAGGLAGDRSAGRPRIRPALQGSYDRPCLGDSSLRAGVKG